MRRVIETCASDETKVNKNDLSCGNDAQLLMTLCISEFFAAYDDLYDPRREAPAVNSPARQRGVREMLATRPKGPAHFCCAYVYARRNACKEQVMPPHSKAAVEELSEILDRLLMPAAQGKP
jgi:hypothetical protein